MKCIPSLYFYLTAVIFSVIAGITKSYLGGALSEPYAEDLEITLGAISSNTSVYEPVFDSAMVFQRASATIISHLISAQSLPLVMNILALTLSAVMFLSITLESYSMISPSRSARMILGFSILFGSGTAEMTGTLIHLGYWLPMYVVLATYSNHPHSKYLVFFSTLISIISSHLSFIALPFLILRYLRTKNNILDLSTCCITLISPVLPMVFLNSQTAGQRGLNMPSIEPLVGAVRCLGQGIFISPIGGSLASFLMRETLITLDYEIIALVLTLISLLFAITLRAVPDSIVHCFSCILSPILYLTAFIIARSEFYDGNVSSILDSLGRHFRVVSFFGLLLMYRLIPWARLNSRHINLFIIYFAVIQIFPTLSQYIQHSKLREQAATHFSIWKDAVARMGILANGSGLENKVYDSVIPFGTWATLFCTKRENEIACTMRDGNRNEPYFVISQSKLR